MPSPSSFWNAKESAKFISALFQPGDRVLVRPIETWSDADGKKNKIDFEGITYLLIGSKDGHGNWAADIPRLESSISKINERAITKKANVCFGVCPRFGGNRQYDKAWQIRTVRALWLDIDDHDPTETLRIAEEKGFPRPSIVVNSGNGVHLYWVLSEPVVIDDVESPRPVLSETVESNGTKRRRQYFVNAEKEKVYLDVRSNIPDLSPKAQKIQDILSGMASLLGGDHTQDLSRSLRIPGTANQKEARNGADPKPCSIVEINDLRYPISNFERFLENSPTRIRRSKIAQVPLPELRRTGTKTWDRFNELLAMCATAEVGDRSETDFALCCFCVERGISKSEAWQRASSVGKFAEKGGEVYFDRTWDSAEQHTRERTYERAIHHAKTGKLKAGREAHAGSTPVDGSAPMDILSEDRKICDDLGIDVLGEIPEGGVKVFSKYFGKTVILPRVVFSTITDMLQKFGPVVREKVHTGKDPIPGMHTLTRVQEAIALLGGSEAAGDDVELGQGVWRAKDDTLILVNPKVSSAWDGRSLVQVKSPRIAGMMINMDLPTTMKWYDHEKLLGYLAMSADPDWCEGVIDETARIFKRWNWRTTMDAAPQLVAGLILCTFVETAWTWRPLVAITAESDAGKSVFFETLSSIFGPLALLNAKSTEAGIRQSVGMHAKAILCDEFENDVHREKILEFFRTASRGSQTLRGTSGQTAQRYGLKHIPWCAAVGIKLDRAPDRNRFIFLEFLPVPRERRGKLDLPKEEALADLGQKMLAIALRNVVAADNLAIKLRNTQIDGVHGRVVESYSTVAAMLAVSCGLDEGGAINLIRQLVAKTEQDAGSATKDQTELLGDILSSEVLLDHGKRATVAQILNNPLHYEGGWEALERCGIRPIGIQNGDAFSNEFCRTSLFFACTTLRRYILKGTRWTGEPTDQILLRLDGAKRGQHKVGGHNPRGVDVPWELIKNNYLQDNNND